MRQEIDNKALTSSHVAWMGARSGKCKADSSALHSRPQIATSASPSEFLCSRSSGGVCVASEGPSSSLPVSLSLLYVFHPHFLRDQPCQSRTNISVQKQTNLRTRVEIGTDTQKAVNHPKVLASQPNQFHQRYLTIPNTRSEGPLPCPLQIFQSRRMHCWRFLSLLPCYFRARSKQGRLCLVPQRQLQVRTQVCPCPHPPRSADDHGQEE